MEILVVLVVLILLYLSCVTMSYFEIRHLHGDEGLLSGVPTDLFSFVFCVVPLLNIAPSCDFIGRKLSRGKSKNKKKKNFDRFFKLNK